MYSTKSLSRIRTSIPSVNACVLADEMEQGAAEKDGDQGWSQTAQERI